MSLHFSVINNAWLFLFGGQPLRLHGAPMFFDTRKAAVAAARDLRLDVEPASKGGRVFCVD